MNDIEKLESDAFKELKAEVPRDTPIESAVYPPPFRTQEHLSTTDEAVTMVMPGIPYRSSFGRKQALLGAQALKHKSL